MNIIYELSDNSDQLATCLIDENDRKDTYSIENVESIFSQEINNNINHCEQNINATLASSPSSSSTSSLSSSVQSSRSLTERIHTSKAAVDFSNMLYDGVKDMVPSKLSFCPGEQHNDAQINGPMGRTSTLSSNVQCDSCTNTNRLGSIEITAIRSSLKTTDQAIGNDNQTLKSLVKRDVPQTLEHQNLSHSQSVCDKHHHQNALIVTVPVDSDTTSLLLSDNYNSSFQPLNFAYNRCASNNHSLPVNEEDHHCFFNDYHLSGLFKEQSQQQNHNYHYLVEPFGGDFIMPTSLNDSKAQSEAPALKNEEARGKILNNNDDFKVKSYLNLNSISTVEFFEGYRNRNSSQRPLVAEESFSSGSTFSVHTGITDNEPASVASEGGLIMRNESRLADNFKEEKILPHDSRSTVSSIPERGQWSGQLDFIFSCISYAVGLGNVWRFPYLCYTNGGGAFLIPYLICVFTLGIPLFIMEVGLGQFTSSGGISIWNKIPIMKGVGYASMVMIGLCNTYYIIIISWTLYFLANSFMEKLPWSHCGNYWNSEQCLLEDANIDNAKTPSSEFWNKKVLNISDDFGEIGGIQLHLFITLIIAWILVYFVIYKGIHQSGKIIWFTAMFPYVILTILFGYGISLVGSGDGISFYLTPEWSKLKEAEIWVAAGTQLLFTYGIGIGTNIALGSYNTFHHNFFRDSVIACVLSSCTSLFSGFVIFSLLGHLAHELGVKVDSVADEGPGLTFVVYPEAVARLPFPQLWAVLFFVMLLILGIDSQFCTVESFITGLVDEFPKLLRKRRQLFTTIIVLIHLVIGLSMITRGGMYIFQLMDNFSASGISLMIVVLCEIIGFCWVYGGDNIYRHMETMLGFRPPRFFYYLWVFVAPLILLSILIFSIVRYSPPEMRKGEVFPWQGQLLGWIISSSSIICIPIYFVYYIFFKCDSSLTYKERLIQGFSDPTNSAQEVFESNSNLEESFNCDVEKCSAIDLLNNIHDKNQNPVIGKPTPV